MQMGRHRLLGSAGLSLAAAEDKEQVTDRDVWSLVPHMPGLQSPEAGHTAEGDGWSPHLALQAPAPPLQLRGRRKRESTAFPKFN